MSWWRDDRAFSPHHPIAHRMRAHVTPRNASGLHAAIASAQTEQSGCRNGRRPPRPRPATGNVASASIIVLPPVIATHDPAHELVRRAARCRRFRRDSDSRPSLLLMSWLRTGASHVTLRPAPGRCRLSDGDKVPTQPWRAGTASPPGSGDRSDRWRYCNGSYRRKLGAVSELRRKGAISRDELTTEYAALADGDRGHVSSPCSPGAQMDYSRRVNGSHAEAMSNGGPASCRGRSQLACAVRTCGTPDCESDVAGIRSPNR